MNTIRASVVQAGTVFGSLEDTLQKVDKYVDLAKADGAELVVFPEALYVLLFSTRFRDIDIVILHLAVSEVIQSPPLLVL
jgi:predicted amidohydrolase